MEQKIERKKAAWAFENNGLATVTFPSGTTAEFHMSLLPDEINTELVKYGFKQKLSDSLAGYEGSDDDKADLLRAMYDQLKAGEWTSRREAQPRLDANTLIVNMVKAGIDEETAKKLVAASKVEKKAKK
jgi:hypothetical protein